MTAPLPSLTPPEAVREQLWNEQQLAQPVAVPGFRLWRYREPAIVLGCSQRRLLAQADARMPVLLRQSGGGAVLTGPWMLGLSVALPPDHPLARQGLVASYRWLGEALAQVLRQGGVDAQALAPEALRAMPAAQHTAVDWACFGGLSPWEVLAGGRKIAGLAQVRRASGVLLVGGVLLQPSPWRLMCEALGCAAADARTLADTTISAGEAVPHFDGHAYALRLERVLAATLEPEASLP
ncbi:lipoate--protein ligase family protein [Paenacidovorax monticola]|uniref:Ligase n=1 Tax=Paenacidovorax monticola TaxID=1926868 RepID=A0A7H0HJ01_9BURK|nr:ligase [Paenacidovorax monticola]QNP60517.1 ligase [Paenacidovorax monticola]